MALPSTAISLKVLYTAEKPTKVKVSLQEPGSRESEVLPPARPRRRTPPGFGVASPAQAPGEKPMDSAAPARPAMAPSLRKSRRSSWKPWIA
ncbi:hypothetical protein D3C85_1498520 [compost metagenome]